MKMLTLTKEEVQGLIMRRNKSQTSISKISLPSIKSQLLRLIFQLTSGVIEKPRMTLMLLRIKVKWTLQMMRKILIN